MIAGSADYVNKYPVATKRVLRAILKAADFCASNPKLAAQELVDRGFLPNYDYALATLKETPHDKWRDYDAEDSMRFYALRMQETGMIKSSPQTDHRQRHGLAFPQRAEARAEDVSCRHAVPFSRKESHMQIIQNRRRFLAGAAAAGAAGLLGTPTRPRAEPPPETTSVRLPAFPKISDCMTPIYISQDLLRAEGFTDITLVTEGTVPDSSDWIEHGELDFDWNYPPAAYPVDRQGVHHSPGGPACRLPRTGGERSRPGHPRPQGQARRRG